MKRINLRWFLFFVTVLCIVLPPFVYRALDYQSEKHVWNSFYDAKRNRELALAEWRARQKAGEDAQRLASASEQYYLEDSLVADRFDVIIEMYNLEIGPDGGINAANPGFFEAKKKYATRR